MVTAIALLIRNNITFIDVSKDAKELEPYNLEKYVSIDPDVDSIKNDEETKNWLSKYIDVK